MPRRRLLFAVWLTVLALPILVLDNVPRTDARAEVRTAPIATTSTSAATVPTVAPAGASADTSTTAAPDTAPTTTAALRRPTAAHAKATVAPSTTTTTTTTAPPNEQVGGASWYDYRPGECAHLTIPKGTVVTVTDLATGASVTCVVTDRGPHGAGRIIDLDRATFAQLADPSSGIIQVRITW